MSPAGFTDQGLVAYAGPMCKCMEPTCQRVHYAQVLAAREKLQDARTAKGGGWVKGTLAPKVQQHECKPPQPAGDGKLLYVERGDVWECHCGQQFEVTGPVVFNARDYNDMGTIRYAKRETKA